LNFYSHTFTILADRITQRTHYQLVGGQSSTLPRIASAVRGTGPNRPFFSHIESEIHDAVIETNRLHLLWAYIWLLWAYPDCRISAFRVSSPVQSQHIVSNTMELMPYSLTRFNCVINHNNQIPASKKGRDGFVDLNFPNFLAISKDGIPLYHSETMAYYGF
jgi:hypothetical protein